jgi:hypothetical protein
MLKVFWRQVAWFIKSESILAPKGASRFKTQNIRCDTMSFFFANDATTIVQMNAFFGVVITTLNFLHNLKIS